MINFAKSQQNAMSDNGLEYRIDYKSLEEGTYEVDYHLDKDFFAMFDDPLVEDGDADVHVVFKVSPAALQFHFEINGSLSVECDRCLEHFDMPVENEYDMVAKIGDEASPEEENDDFITISSKDREIDLSKHIYELAVLSLPPQRVHPCDEDGNPTCNPDMLSRFQIEDPDGYADMDGCEFGSGADDDDDLFQDADFQQDDEDPDSPGDDPFQGQEMETIEQKLSKSPAWDKLKSLLNKDTNK